MTTRRLPNGNVLTVRRIDHSAEFTGEVHNADGALLQRLPKYGSADGVYDAAFRSACQQLGRAMNHARVLDLLNLHMVHAESRAAAERAPMTPETRRDANGALDRGDAQFAAFIVPLLCSWLELHAQADNLTELIADYMEGRADVNDGGDSGPQPNCEMNLAGDIDAFRRRWVMT